MMPTERIKMMEERLTHAFSPASLTIIDDSERHRGHEGSRNGAGHYQIIISASFFQGKSKIAAHQEIYKIFSDLIPQEIHALQIKILPL